MQQPERRRREGRCSARFAFARRSSLFCVPVLFLYLCLLLVYVFHGFHVGSAMLQCGTTPPSVMVLFISKFIQIKIYLHQNSNDDRTGPYAPSPPLVWFGVYLHLSLFISKFIHIKVYLHQSLYTSKFK